MIHNWPSFSKSESILLPIGWKRLHWSTRKSEIIFLFSFPILYNVKSPQLNLKMSAVWGHSLIYVFQGPNYSESKDWNLKHGGCKSVFCQMAYFHWKIPTRILRILVQLTFLSKFLESDSLGIRSKFSYHEIEHRSRNPKPHRTTRKSSHIKNSVSKFTLHISKNTFILYNYEALIIHILF